MSEKDLISFITICYNGFSDTCDLIDSLQNNITSVAYEIVVVDNASLTDEALRLQHKYPSITAIRSSVNLGFSGGNNLGMKNAKGNYFFFINNDTLVADDKLAILVDRFRNNPDIGGISPKIKFAYTPQLVQYAGFTPLTAITLRNKTIGYGTPDCDALNHPYPTPYLHGAAMMVKREVADRVGAMPEIYFLCYEEIEWSTRMTKHGYELWYDPHWTIYHKESRSMGSLSQLQIFFLTRNRMLYAWRNRKSVQRWLSVIYQICIASTRSCITHLFNKRFDLIAATLSGAVAFITQPHKNDNN